MAQDSFSRITTQPAAELSQTQRDYFESCVLAALMQDPGYWQTWGEILCWDKAGRRPVFVSDFQNPVDNAVFETFRRYRKLVPGAPQIVNWELLLALLKQVAAEGLYGAMAMDIDAVVARSQEVASRNLGDMMPYLDAETPKWLAQKRTVLQFRQLTSNGGAWDPESVLSALASTAQKFQTSDQIAVSHFADELFTTDEDKPRMRTHLRQLDTALGGGLTYDEATLVIGCQGSGKTVFSSQLGATLAMTNNLPGVLVTTEQPPLDYELRILSQRCNIPYGRIKDGLGKNGQNLSAKELEMVQDVIQHLRGRLLFVDWRRRKEQSFKQMLGRELESIQNKYGRMHWLMVDWIGGGMGEITAELLQHYRLVLQSAADSLVQIGISNHMAVIALAQAHPVKGKDNPKVDESCIAECKSMGRDYTNVFGISALYDPRLKSEELEPGKSPYAMKQNLFLSKARKSVGGMVPWKRDYEFQRMLDW
jgi:hypothetical protein